MNKFKFYFILPLLSIVLFSCSKDDDKKVTPPREYADQYPVDIDLIETYLKTHTFKVVEVDGRTDVKIDTLTAGKVSIWDNTEYPLKFKMVKNDRRRTNFVDGRVNDPVDYKMYYFIVNEGGGAPATRFDSTFVSYRGFKLNNKQFDATNNPLWFTFPKVSSEEGVSISGFRQFTALLKGAESFNVGADGAINYSNYGVGVVFLPSGLGYFNESQATIPAYTPIAFTIRLHSVRERDHDRDSVLSKYENGDGKEDLYTVDTDGDNVPDFLDIDDDDDNIRTILETRFTYIDADGKTVTAQYPFNGALVDDPATPYDERKGIPDCSGDFVNPSRLRKHLDPNKCP